MSSGTLTSPQIDRSGWTKAASARLKAWPAFPHVNFPVDMLMHTKFHFTPTNPNTALHTKFHLTPANSNTVTVRRENCYILAKQLIVFCCQNLYLLKKVIFQEIQKITLNKEKTSFRTKIQNGKFYIVAYKPYDRLITVVLKNLSFWRVKLSQIFFENLRKVPLL